jgi:hypothetical protein
MLKVICHQASYLVSCYHTQDDIGMMMMMMNHGSHKPGGIMESDTEILCGRDSQLGVSLY